jgi:hypothetical protein
MTSREARHALSPRRSAASDLYGIASPVLVLASLLAAAFVVVGGPASAALAYTVASGLLMTMCCVVSSAATGDVMTLSNAVPVGYLVFLLPGALALALDVSAGDSPSLTLGTLPILVGTEAAEKALRWLVLGVAGYCCGTVFALRNTAQLDRNVSPGAAESERVLLDKCIAVALMSIAGYFATASAVLGNYAAFWAAASDSTARQATFDVWYRTVPILFVAGLLAALTFAFGRLVAQRRWLGAILCIVGFGFGGLLTLPYGNRSTALMCFSYPLFIWHYFRRKVSLVFLCASFALLFYIGSLFVGFRYGGLAQPVQYKSPTELLLQESPMAFNFAKTLEGFDTGAVGYQYGKDVIGVVTFFIPRAWWPAKPLPLDYRLSVSLGLASPNAPYGTPIGIFGGLWINSSIVGLCLLSFAIGYSVARTHALLPMHSLKTIGPRVVLFQMLVDLTRVGDFSREFVTALIYLTLFAAVYYVVGPPTRVKAWRRGRPTPGLL